MLSHLLDFFTFSSLTASNFLMPSTLSEDLCEGLLSFNVRRSDAFCGLSPSAGGGVAEEPINLYDMLFRLKPVP